MYYQNVPFSEPILNHFETQIGQCSYCCSFVLLNHSVVFCAIKVLVLKHFFKKWCTIISRIFPHVLTLVLELLILLLKLYLPLGMLLSLFRWRVSNLRNGSRFLKLPLWRFTHEDLKLGRSNNTEWMALLLRFNVSKAWKCSRELKVIFDMRLLLRSRCFMFHSSFFMWVCKRTLKKLELSSTVGAICGMSMGISCFPAKEQFVVRYPFHWYLELNKILLFLDGFVIVPVK